MAHQEIDEPTVDNGVEDTTRLLTVIRDLATELHPRQQAPDQVTLDSSLDRELGFDSLGRVELLVRLEQEFDITLPEEVLASADVPRDLLRAVIGAHGVSKVVVPEAAEAVVLGAADPAPRSANTLVEAFEWHVTAHPDRPHIRLYSDDDDGEVITYGGLWAGAEKVASGLQQLGLRPGESVVIMLATGRDYFQCFLGTLLAGGVPVPIYPPARPSQVEDHLRRHVVIVDNCRAGVMITMPEAVRLAQLMRAQAPRLRHLVTPGDIEDKATGDYQRPALVPEDIAFLQYTSGSTGSPKGVILTHANLLANIRAMGESLNVSADDVFVSWLPLYHDMGLIGAWLGTMYFAVPVVIMSPLAFIARPQRWLWAIHRFRGTISAAPNFAYELCLNRIGDQDLEGLDLSSWRLAANGAEAVSPETIERFATRFADFGFKPETMAPVYGLAECSVGLAFPPVGRQPLIDRVHRTALMENGRAEPAHEDEPYALRFVACGQPLPGHQVRIVDSHGRELPDRHQGRLQFLGPSATSGYLRAPEQTRDLFDGAWLDSGDKAYIAEGDIFITGRAKDIIIRAGRNLYPEEMEEEVGKVEGVRSGRVAVFGSPDPATGTERLIILAETRDKDEAVLAEQRRQITAIATDLSGTPPDDIVLAPPDTILKTSSGKIRRAACRERYERGEIGRGGRSLWLQIARVALSSVFPQMRRSLRDLGTALYAGYAWVVFGLAAILLWPTLVILPVEAWRWWFGRGALAVLTTITGLRVRLQGGGNLPSKDQACVFVVNHQSYLDGFTLIAALKRTFSFVAKAELKGNVFARAILSRFGTEFVERFDFSRSVEDANRIAERGRGGRSLLFFAEGTLTRMPGLLPFRMGAFEAAVAAKLRVVPLALKGTRWVLRDGSWFPRRGQITVIAGPPIDTAKILATFGDDAFAAAVELREQTRRWILRYSGEPDLQHERTALADSYADQGS